jgi:hypothetical protein
MRTFVAGMLAASAILLTGCASIEAVRSAEAFAAEAQNAHVRGDNYTAANLFFRAYKSNPTVKNRFNLAAAYASIGRTDLAVQMYTALVADGEFTHFSEVHSYDGGYAGEAQQSRVFNVSDESRVRIAGILARGPTASTGSDPDSGTGLSDEDARAMDAQRRKAGTSGVSQP